MQDKIIAAIAEYFEPRYDTISSKLLQATNEQQVNEILNTVATEIHAAIAPLLEPEQPANKDPDFLEWLDKWFVREDNITRYKSKNNGVLYTDLQVEELYKRTAL